MPPVSQWPLSTVLLAALLAGACSGDEHRAAKPSPSGTAPGTPTPTSASPSPTPARDGSDLEISEDVLRGLKKGDCVSGAGQPVETRCDAPDAVVKVLGVGRRGGTLPDSAQRYCPTDTDYPLTVYSASGTSTASPDSPLDAPAGYVCLRNLRGSHPGRPGAGGGVIRIGDCIDADASTPVTEVACASGYAKYKITGYAARILGDSCPRGEGRASFQTFGDLSIEYCARHL
ncbi:hypothetical protein [Actinomadura fibrosa]|uniref:Uncharacterized protein n=1 Tax=Actinomadura fibrosa TaxID=111802 RepID=A0ABW2Y0P5_9ACTN|nr:hypothetical protein [Actinomadura fibrosa]